MAHSSLVMYGLTCYEKVLQWLLSHSRCCVLLRLFAVWDPYWRHRLHLEFAVVYRQQRLVNFDYYQVFGAVGYFYGKAVYLNLSTSLRRTNISPRTKYTGWNSRRRFGVTTLRRRNALIMKSNLCVVLGANKGSASSLGRVVSIYSEL